MGISSATLTTTTHANFIPEEWSTEALMAVEFAAMFQKRVNRKYESVLKVGDTVNIPRQSNLSTQTKSSGLSNVVVWEAITENLQTISVATVEYAAFLVEDPAAVQMNQDVAAGYSKKIGYALSRGREVTLTALIASLSQTLGALGTPLTPDEYLSAHRLMLSAGIIPDNMSANDDFSLFLSPEEWVSALKVEEFTNRDYNSEGDAIQRARVGKIYSYPVFVSNLMTANGAGHDLALMHRDCFALVVQEEVPVRSDYIIESLGSGYVGWNLYGVAEMNFPPETPGGGSAVDNRGVYLKAQ